MLSNPDPLWTLVLPVKGGPTAKSRLPGPPGLAEAIALDTVHAVLGCPRVRRTVVVTAAAPTAAGATALGACVRAEQRPGAGLDAAVRDGLVGVHGFVAVLLADLPALRSDDLTEALDRLAGLLAPARSAADRLASGAPGRWLVVPDAEGSGTVLIAAAQPADLQPAFGPGSAAAHEARGAVRLELGSPRLQGDVDTADDLARARSLGLGPRTAAVLDAPAADARRALP